jgi:hypothetical protein
MQIPTAVAEQFFEKFADSLIRLLFSNVDKRDIELLISNLNLIDLKGVNEFSSIMGYYRFRGF